MRPCEGSLLCRVDRAGDAAYTAIKMQVPSKQQVKEVYSGLVGLLVIFLIARGFAICLQAWKTRK